MSDRSNKYWFPAKRYGWGWGFPRMWQGWVVFFAYLAAVVAISFSFSPAQNAPAFYAALVIATIVLFLVCWLKGEPPRWRWGGK